MNPKEKADQLYFWYNNLLEPYLRNEELNKNIVKKCAIIAVDEIIEALNCDDAQTAYTQNFWQSVKTELKRM